MAKPERLSKLERELPKFEHDALPDQVDAINALVDRIIAAATAQLEEQIAELRAMRAKP
jgi:hypothetical protein